MNRQSAVAAATAEAPRRGVPPGAIPAEPQQTWIELPSAVPTPPPTAQAAPAPAPQPGSVPAATPEPLRPVPIMDMLVWIVRFWHGPSWIDLAVSDADGKVVRVTRSRNFVNAHGGAGVEYAQEAR